MNTFDEMLNEFNQPSNNYNPTDQPEQKRYNSSTGRRTAARSKTQRITRKDRMELVNSKDLNVLKGQIDTSFKQILAAADNTSLEAYVIGRLNMIKRQIDQKINKELQKQSNKK